MVNIIGFYTTQFGELWEKSLTSLIREAILGVINDAGVEKKQIDVVFFANMLSGVLENNLMLPARIAEILESLAAYRMETNPPLL